MSNRNRADLRGWRRAYLTVGACIALLFIGAMLERLGTPASVIVSLIVACLAAMTLAAAWTGGTMSVERYSRAAIHSTSGLGLWIAADATVTACLLAVAVALALVPAPTLPAIAGIVGCIAATVLFGPAVRSSGASTVPAFLEQRYGKVAVGMVASVAAAALCLLLALALFEVAARAMSSVIGLERWEAAGFLAAFLCLVGIVGGMRSVARVQPLHLIMLLFAGVAVAGWLTLFDSAAAAALPGWSDLLPAVGEAGGARGLMEVACVTIAMAAMPHLLIRLATPSDSTELRGIAGSTTLSTLSVVAALAVAAASFPHFFLLGDAQTEAASRIPVALAAFTAAACLSLLVGAATSLLLAASATLSQDLYRGLFDRRITAGKALFLSRISFLAIAAGAALLISNGTFDLPTLIRPALTLAAAALFPALVLAVFVPGSTGFGVIAALLVGGAFAGYDVATATGIAGNWRLPGDIPTAIFALPVSFAAAMAVSALNRWRAKRAASASSSADPLATGDRSPG